MAQVTETFEINIADLSQLACIAGIEELTRAIDERLPDLVLDDWFLPVFVAPDQRLDEEAFFGHVGSNYPEAVPALAALVKTFDMRAPEIEFASGERLYGMDEEVGETGALAHALQALKSMDLTALPVVKSRDDSHEGNLRAAEETMAVEVPLLDLSEPACIAAIDKLAEAIAERLPDLTWRSHFCPVFISPDSCLSEAEFFEHVGINCPGAIPAMRSLINTYAAAVREHYAPLSGLLLFGPDDDGRSAGALARAMWALASMGADVVLEFKAYMSTINVEQEFFVLEKTWPAFLEAYGWRDEKVLRLGLYAMLRGLHSDRHSTMWVDLGMRDAVQQLTTAQAFAGLMNEEAQAHHKPDENWQHRGDAESYIKRKTEAPDYFFRDFIRQLDLSTDFDVEIRQALLAVRPEAAELLS